MKRLLLFLIFLPFLAYAQDKLEENWYSLLLDSKTVGFLHQTTWQTAEGLIRSEIEQTMEIRRFGVPFSLTQTDLWLEDRDGVLVSVSSGLDMNGQNQRIQVRVMEQELRVRLHRGSEKDELILPLEQEPRGPYAVGREVMAMVSDHGRKGKLEYRLFSPDTMKIEEVRLSVLGPGELKDSLGRTHLGVLVKEQTSALPGVVTTEVYDGQGEFLYSKTPVGLELEILRLEHDPHRRGVPEPEEFAAVFDVASMTVPVEGIEDLTLEESDALSVLFRGSGVSALYEAVRAAEEDLTPSEGTGAVPLRIVSTEKDVSGRVSGLVLHLENQSSTSTWANLRSESIPQSVQNYLEGGFHLDLADPRLAELLKRCGIAQDGSEGHDMPNPAGILCLERLVDRYIENKSLAYGFAGLEEVLSQREGDCTEHALLLVALLRKAGVPARLAFGMVLTEGGFLGHAWVELFADGSWHWLDPSFPGGRPYGFKVRLGVMDPAQPVWASLSLVLLQVVGSVEAEILDVTLR